MLTFVSERYRNVILFEVCMCVQARVNLCVCALHVGNMFVLLYMSRTRSTSIVVPAEFRKSHQKQSSDLSSPALATRCWYQKG